MLDKFGKCPTCKCNWDGGDIKDHIAQMEVFEHRTEQEIVNIAASYGWSAHTPNRFTKLISINRGPGKVYWRCPNCRDTYDQVTGEKISYERIVEEERERFTIVSKLQQKSATF